jgi:hypothetical protein
LTHRQRAVGWGRVRLGSGDFVEGERRSTVGKKVILFGLLVLCSLGLMAASAQAGVTEVWVITHGPVKWTSNHGDHGMEILTGELRVTVSGGKATNIASTVWAWNGPFTAANQPWRNSSIKVNHLIFSAVTPQGDVVVGDLRPNRTWTRLTGKIRVTEADPIDPATSYYYEVTVTAVYDHNL